MSEGERQTLALKLYDDWQETDISDSLEIYCYDQGRADAEVEIKPLLKAIKFVLEDYSIRLGDYAKIIDEKLKEQRE